MKNLRQFFSSGPVALHENSCLDDKQRAIPLPATWPAELPVMLQLATCIFGGAMWHLEPHSTDEHIGTGVAYPHAYDPTSSPPPPALKTYITQPFVSHSLPIVTAALQY